MGSFPVSVGGRVLLGAAFVRCLGAALVSFDWNRSLCNDS